MIIYLVSLVYLGENHEIPLMLYSLSSYRVQFGNVSIYHIYKYEYVFSFHLLNAI